MKKLSFLLSLMALMMLSMTFTSCSNSDDDTPAPRTFTNTYKARNYTHAWMGNTLVIMSTDGEHKKVIWTKLNGDDMRILDEGTLDIQVAEGYNVLTTSGILTYRKSDNKLFYFYYCKGETTGGGKTETTKEPNFHIVVINPETMAVESNITNSEAAEMQGSAYGELLQNFICYDENDNMYMTAFTTSGKKSTGKLLRIKKGEFDFETGYNAVPGIKGKLITIQYIGNNKVFAYMGDGSGSSIDSYAYFYAIVDLNAKTWTRIQYNGADLPVSAGSFSQRSAVNTVENKVYFAIDPETGDAQVYIYDIATGNVTAGAKVASGYYLDQIRFFTSPTPHYDLTATVENEKGQKHGGMGRDAMHYTQTLTSLSDTEKTIDFKGVGAEISEYTMECIYNGTFMYQIPISSDRYSKLQFANNKVNVIQEQKFN